MKIRTSLIATSVILSLMVSCSTFPTKQLTLDVTSFDTPIMLSKGTLSDRDKKLDFEAGYSASAMSLSSTANGVTTTMSMSDARNDNKPLAFQLNNTLIQEPKWVSVDRIDLVNSYYMLIIVGAIEKKNYTLGLTIALPSEGKK